jgi:hypothetical protein
VYARSGVSCLNDNGPHRWREAVARREPAALFRLARAGYFDDSRFYRVVYGFIAHSESLVTPPSPGCGASEAAPGFGAHT